jgi:hypothetical protein
VGWGWVMMEFEEEEKKDCKCCEKKIQVPLRLKKIGRIKI